MWHNLVGDQIRRANRNLFLANCALLLLVAALVAGNWRYLSNVVRGPLSVTPAQLTGFANPGSLDRCFFDVPGLAPRPTGISYVKRDHGVNRTEWVLLAAKVGDRYLLIKADHAAPEAVYSGSLDTPSDELRARLSASLSPGEYQQTFYPYLLDATGFRAGGIAGMSAAAICALFALVNLLRAGLRATDFARSPIARQLARFGPPTETVAAAIDAEFRQGPATMLGKTWFTNTWLLHERPCTFDILPLNEVVWVYQRVTTHYYSFIPVGKSRQLEIRSRTGRTVTIRGREKQLTAAMEYLGRRMPWIALGFSRTAETAFRRDSAQFSRTIDQRRDTYLQQLCQGRRQNAGASA